MSSKRIQDTDYRITHEQYQRILNREPNMTREDAKELLHIIQAFVEGKQIEYSNDGEDWLETATPTWDADKVYRIKPEAKYRPFEMKEECWKEMLKHQPFGWLHDNFNDVNVQLCFVSDGGAALTGNAILPYDVLIERFTFIDGSPFGIKEE